jgi:GNAT superfamily N-acetyltransferase
MSAEGRGLGDVDIGALNAADAPGVADLMIEMQAYYAVPCPPRETILARLSVFPPGVRALVARSDGRALGFAFFSAIWPGPGLKPGLFLKELYVAKAARGHGVGGVLMKALIALAEAEGYSRIDFTAADKPALTAFYARHGARPLKDRSFFRIGFS